MKSLSLFFYEWKHFVRNPFKIIAVLLFIGASVYGLHNGAGLYHEQLAEIERIKEKTKEERQKYQAYYQEGKKGPEDRPWVDMTSPFWAIWYNGIYHFKTPSPALAYSIGQAEQYGFYKRVSFNASTYDADMTKEIANPERLHSGALDFSFSLLFLLPLLLLLLLYNLKSSETEQGFLPIIEVQTASTNSWLIRRVAFYAAISFLVVVGLLVYGALLTDLFSSASSAFLEMVTYSFLYLTFWSVIYTLILWNGKAIMDNALRMVGVWLLFAFLVPAMVLQWVSIKKPVNLMTDLIEVTRDDTWDLYDQPDSVIQTQLNALFPEIVDSPIAKDSLKQPTARSRSIAALVNEMMKKSIEDVEMDNQAKNDWISTSYLISPVTFFQNRFNRISQTHYQHYQNYRNEIQGLIDKQVRTLVLDTWNDVQVDQSKFLEYQALLNL